MNIQDMKNTVEDYLMKAQVALQQDGFLSPLLLIFNDNDEIREQSLTIESDEDERNLQELLGAFSRVSKAIILIMPSAVVDLPDEEAEPFEIKSHPDARECISCFIYTKEETHFRRMPFSEKEGYYSFHDLGWEDIAEHYANYLNPFFNKENQAP